MKHGDEQLVDKSIFIKSKHYTTKMIDILTRFIILTVL